MNAKQVTATKLLMKLPSAQARNNNVLIGSPSHVNSRLS